MNSHESVVKSLQEIKTMLERKLYMAKTSAAFQKGTNQKTVIKLARQINAINESISRFE